MTDELRGREARIAARRRLVRRRRLVLGAVLALVVLIAAGAVALSGGGDRDAAGKSGASGGSSSGAGAAAGEAASAETVPAPESSTPPLRKPSRKWPLRVYFGGDSLSGMPGVMFDRRAKASGLMSVRLDYQVSSRLTVPDPVDWPARLRAQLKGRRYDVGVFLIGINDPGMPMLVDGQSTSYPKQPWLREYQARVEELMRIMLESGVKRVYWAGLPPMPTSGQHGAVRRLNQLFKAAADQHAQVVYVDAFTPLATNAGGFDPQLRSGDGVHFTDEGANRIATAVWQAMKADWTPAETVTPAP